MRLLLLLLLLLRLLDLRLLLLMWLLELLVLLALDPDAKTKTIKIARSLLEYDVPIRMLDHGEYEDVGAMSKKEFSRRRQDAKPWNNTQGLLAKIQSMPLGSIL